ncbi:MAG: Gfo/Idh/MocA family oxidoreductase [Balneolaceae bacterium]
MKTEDRSRRSFLKKMGATAAGMAMVPMAVKAGNNTEILKFIDRGQKKYSANDHIRLALIGTGGMGIGDAQTALDVSGVEIVAACDLYEGRRRRAKELWGEDIQTTGDYRELLDRSDVDVIINATTDHWHEQINVDAMKAGKHVYCEKPMVQKVDEGHRVIQAQEESGVVFQVGSQYTSSLLSAKAKELVDAGEIGDINFVEAIIDRHSALGAWQYSIPPDASTETVDWGMYQRGVTDLPWDPKRFFRWRNYRDYGTGQAGDLYVHMLSMLHFITGSHGPTRAISTGGLRYWKDGRDVPDIHLGLYDYPDTEQHPAFNLALRTNFVSGDGGQFLFRIVGSEGDISIGWSSLTLRKNPLPEAPGMSVGTFPEDVREQFIAEYNATYPQEPKVQEPNEFTYRDPDNYKGMRYDHFVNFFESVRNGTPVLQDATFGLRAAGPTFAGNLSYYEDRIVGWDPQRMRMTS